MRLATAVEFLHPKRFLMWESNPNARITEEQYDLLVTLMLTDKAKN